MSKKSEVKPVSHIRDGNIVYDVIRVSDDNYAWMKYTKGGEQEIIEDNVICVGSKEYTIGLPKFPQDVLTLATGIGRKHGANELLDEIISLSREPLVLPSEEDRVALGCHLLSSWVFDEYSHLSYFAAIGPAGAGKSELLDFSQLLSFKAFRASGSDSFSTVFRNQHKISGTSLMDECQKDSSDPSTEFHKFIAEGNSKKGTVKRTRFDKNNEGETDCFYSFGPKLFTGASFSSHEAITSRTYEIVMPLLKPNELVGTISVSDKEFQLRVEKLRNDLLLFRQRRICGELKAPNLDQKFAESLSNYSGREKQVFNWLLKECPSENHLIVLLKAICDRRDKIKSRA